MSECIVTITDMNDPRVEVYRNMRDADLRGRDKLFMAESELVVRRLLRTPQRLHSLFLSPNKFERLREAIEEAHEAASHARRQMRGQVGGQAGGRAEGEFPIYLAPVELMSEVAGFLIHRGALAAGYRPSPEQLSLDAALGHLRPRRETTSFSPAGPTAPSSANVTLLLAEGITNVDNMGGLFRNAAAFGIDGVALDPTCCDPLYRKAIRVSVGHTLSMPYAVSESWADDLARLKHEWDMTLIGAEATAGALPLWQMPRNERAAIVVGSEAHGLSRQTLDLCDAVVEVPMSPGVPSLNVATASGVLLYERLRAMRAD